ncbi:hypothetical protein T440DRAFT_554320 [Plenodomus tracheiphilus IPT5]|uniref:Uncharacterized protein n=1 Tax=Plenodomus tracheiphilus IPT5 TaxID=1408161 RepID=A0A6A7BAM4_9PLEO|nr:hypothetical protein T440DRAFT_554320 [Plenodomus tracheiphilus IPT5]
MQFPTTLLPLLLAVLAHSAVLAPRDEATPAAPAEDVINFSTCKNFNMGDCRSWTIVTQSQCIGVSGTDWNDVIKSIIVPNGYRCRLWSSNHCDGQSSPDIYPPGANELGDMNDKTTSFKCYKN